MNTVRSTQQGYTIVETMIFLGVSALLFLSAMIVVNGQQRKTQFSTDVKEFEAKLQNSLNNVASGYYNNPGEVGCTDGSGPVLDLTPTADDQGQNDDCTYIGQDIHLVSPTQFSFTSIAGLRRTSTPPREDVTSLADAKPTPMGNSEIYNLPDGLTAQMRIYDEPTPPVPVRVITRIGTYTTFNQYDTNPASDEFLKSGSSRVQMHAITGAGVATIDPFGGVQICLTDGERVGIIQITPGGTNVTISQTNPCTP